MYSLPGKEDPIRKKLYRSFTQQADRARTAARGRQRAEGEARPASTTRASRCRRRIDAVARQAGDRLLPAVPRPRCRAALQQRRLLGPADPRDAATSTMHPDDVVIYDARGLRAAQGVPAEARRAARAADRLRHRHVLLPHDGRLREPLARTSTCSWSATPRWRRSRPTPRPATPPTRTSRSRRSTN